MENPLMKTAEEVISIILELSPEERQKVVHFLYDEDDEAFKMEEYSPEEMEKLDTDQEEARRGINISPVLEGDEAISYLERLRKS